MPDKGQYFKLADDGAKFRCSGCNELHSHKRVILFQHTETKKREVICLDCVDSEWLAAAECLGTL